MACSCLWYLFSTFCLHSSCLLNVSTAATPSQAPATTCKALDFGGDSERISQPAAQPKAAATPAATASQEKENVAKTPKKPAAEGKSFESLWLAKSTPTKTPTKTPKKVVSDPRP